MSSASSFTDTFVESKGVGGVQSDENSSPSFRRIAHQSEALYREAHPPQSKPGSHQGSEKFTQLSELSQLSGGRTNGDDLQNPASVKARRVLFAALVFGTLAALTTAFGWILNFDGLGALDIAILTLFVVTSVWNIIGFWNAIIGFVLLKSGDWGLRKAAPHVAAGDQSSPISSRTAIVMAVRHEDVTSVIARLQAMEAALKQTDYAALFDFHILSDSARLDVVAAEEKAVATWRAKSAAPQRIHYRRRANNTGFKAGNIHDFCLNAGDAYTFYLPLDADSLMSAHDIIRLVRIMEAHPKIGLLQSLVVGLPSQRFFTRIFQFGMRHGMRTYTTGSAWWQADCGPYWGHNALIRLGPFRDNCKLPRLPGKAPLGGEILSHDQIEAVLLRRAGYECRVLPIEGESFEENPPSLPDFTKRDLRWCQGNMQYFKLLNLPGLRLTSRIQIALAILMYIGSMGWMGFTLMSAVIAHHHHLPTWMNAPLFGPAGVSSQFPVGPAILMFVSIFLMNITPKIAGLFDVLSSPTRRKAYGGSGRTLASFVTEFLFTLLLAPAVALTVTIFMVGLLFGKRVSWDSQIRAGHRVSWATALALYWPHTLLGVALTAVFWTANPIFAAWGAPILLGLTLAPVFAVITASDWLSRLSTKWRLGEVPEERLPSDIVTTFERWKSAEAETSRKAA